MPTLAESPVRIVVTGVGAVTNLGLDAASTWEAMKAGKSGIGLISGSYFSEWDDQEWAVRIGGQIHDFDPEVFTPGREAKKIDRFTQFAVHAAELAVRESGIDFSAEDPERCGVVIGSGVGGIYTIETSTRTLLEKGPKRTSPFTVPKLMANAAAGEVSIRFGLRGHSDAHATACASAGHSIGAAMRLLERGEADVILAGGSEAAISPLCLSAFMTMRALSTRNDEPERASRPFDKDRDGFVLSEGAAVLMLETLDHAKARGANILCELVGFGASSDASHITAPDAEGRGASKSMRLALHDAGLNTDQIDYINAHGTSTPLGDAAEVAAVSSVFGDHALKSRGGKLLMSSSKSMTGHCLGASGGVEMISCMGALQHGIVTPTINCENPDEGFDIDFVPGTAREAKVRYAMNNTFGFGGHNVTILMAKFD